ncbi:MAG: nucleoside deaminase [Candidatus Scalindua sp. AMX11]|nr:MAG: nucleoside deaminase [Candidatus Scalindua sp.]NOG83709.1 nucleoside deaminase [Planctomycetota bacterium]RZV73841.1 MAG: nucleoside deaminase [Candidatus Scalindua sp. SCAELEC01]TDE64849.1 MAG: nucleoside deaminase [Candidatus Scalindua sp. AMX11]GJQ60664.1 MAG: tRNA-specific adenosine deaminase [Candidatus Scalindua sp.]
MFKQKENIQILLPAWLSEFTKEKSYIKDIEDRMSFVIEASQRNIAEETGGPFAAAIFESESGKLISLGVNLVITQGLSILHAEIIAFSLAQIKIGTYDLGADGLAKHELITSTEPCAMCFGAIPWSGVSRVVTSARDADARSIGFDEGPKLDNWRAALRERQIEVVCDIKRNDAKRVLEEYSRRGGLIYNSK